jgi:type IV secretory pathway TrbL component
LEPQPPELQQLFRKVHGNQAAMDGFGENIAAIFAAAAKKAHSVAATAERIQSVDFGSAVELGSRRDRALNASRIEIKIDQITQKSGDISKK